ncbi:MAG: glycosyltransferase [Eubacterium sp.]|nr:glycosyltransferase [Eubacterium sp.]
MISIIIPVYQAAERLNRCMRTVLAQTYTDLEVLLVDDGSTDGSAALCDAYAERDPRVRVFHTENRGVSAARNLGLSEATGDYIAFVDSDDYIDRVMYEKMLETAEKNGADVVLCDCIKEWDNGESEEFTHGIREGFYDKYQLRDEYYPELLMTVDVDYPASISNWLLLFRRELSSGNPLPRYVEGVRFSEDLLFGAELMLACGSFYYMKDAYFYHYCIHKMSASHTFAPDKWKDYEKLYDRALEVFAGRYDPDFNPQIDRMLLFFVWNAVGDILAESDLTVKERVTAAKEILCDPKVQAMFGRIDLWDLPIPAKLKVLTQMYRFRVGLPLLCK